MLFPLFFCIKKYKNDDYFTGATPDRPHQSVDPCSPNPCQNRAICVRHNDGYMCYCVPGFQGSHCQFNVNECISQPCMNGATCEDRVGRFSCSCSPGFTGEWVETQLGQPGWGTLKYQHLNSKQYDFKALIGLFQIPDNTDLFYENSSYNIVIAHYKQQYCW